VSSVCFFVNHAGFLECLQSVSHEQTLQEDYDIGLGYAEPWPTFVKMTLKKKKRHSHLSRLDYHAK